MTTIRLNNGKPILRDGKIGTEQKCCCPGCCVHYCGRLCCSVIKFTYAFASSCDGIGGAAAVSIDTGCYSEWTLTEGECSVTFRVKITCDGYNADENCDTDCTIGDIQYLVDDEWIETMPSILASLTAEFNCEQAEAQYGAPRCASIVNVSDKAACDTLEGVYCPENPTPCQECSLICGPVPTEWRIIDEEDTVWFAGDIIPNPAYTGNGFCLDPWGADDANPNWETPALLLVNYPVAGNSTPCNHRFPSGWPKPFTAPRGGTLQVLGCDGANWTDIYRALQTLCLGAFPNMVVGFYIPQLNVCLSQAFLNWDSLRVDDNYVVNSPPGCSCMRVPGTGQRVTLPSIGNNPNCCRQCNSLLTATCGSGLEYLGHGMGVRFTGAVDEEGTNLWNWEDADGNSPAGWLPTENGWAGTLKDDSDIVIAGVMRGWRPGVAAYGPPVFNSVTLEPGAVLAIGLTTGTLTVDDAAVEDWSGDWASDQCSSGYAINVTGTATFKNGAANRANGDPLQIVGNCVFEDDSVNEGTITGDVALTDSASSTGTINGNVTADATATVGGTVNGDAALSGSAQLTGTVSGTATFTDSACNSGGTAGTFDPDPPPTC